MKLWMSAVVLGAVLAGCGGGGDETTMVAASDTTLAVNPTVAAAVVNTPFVFSAGVPALGTTGTTTVAFTSTATTPDFSISAEGYTATGTTAFGSCIFRVSNSSFPAGHALANGQTITVDPCSTLVYTAGTIANGVSVNGRIALILGLHYSANSPVTFQVDSKGGLKLLGTSVGTITLTPISGGGN